MSELCDFERKILREVAGLEPISSWGAAVGACLGNLKRLGYITHKFDGRLTDKGRAEIAVMRPAQDAASPPET